MPFLKLLFFISDCQQFLHTDNVQTVDNQIWKTTDLEMALNCYTLLYFFVVIVQVLVLYHGDLT